MALLHLRLSLPDRPGALGRLARAMGIAGADIATIAVLEQGAGRAVDDVHVRWPEGRPREVLTTALAGEPGVQLLGLRPSRQAPGAHPELDLLAQIAQVPGRALETLVDMAPSAFAADWAAVAGPDGELRYTSLGAPEAVRLRPVRALRVTAADGDEGRCHGLAPLDGEATLVITRGENFTFHRLELMRLARVVDLARLFVRRCAEAGPKSLRR